MARTPAPRTLIFAQTGCLPERRYLLAGGGIRLRKARAAISNRENCSLKSRAVIGEAPSGCGPVTRPLHGSVDGHLWLRGNSGSCSP